MTNKSKAVNVVNNICSYDHLLSLYITFQCTFADGRTVKSSYISLRVAPSFNEHSLN